jgi:hypothetical protein
MQDRAAAFLDTKKVRVQLDVHVKSLSVQRDVLVNPVSVTLSRGGKLAKSQPVLPCPLVETLPEFSGYGRHMSGDGAVYTGYFRTGRRHGRGALKSPAGEYFAGDWVNDQFHGRGRRVCAEGVYEGEYSSGLRAGGGKFRFANGDAYAGQWRGHYMNGVGTMLYASGAVEEGARCRRGRRCHSSSPRPDSYSESLRTTEKDSRE